MSRETTRYYSLKKALKKEENKPNPDKEAILMLCSEIRNIEEMNKPFCERLNLVKK